MPGLAARAVGKVGAVRGQTPSRVVLTMPADVRLSRLAGVVVADAAARAGLSVHQVEAAAIAAANACATDPAGATVSLEVTVGPGGIDVRAASSNGTTVSVGR